MSFFQIGSSALRPLALASCAALASLVMFAGCSSDSDADDVSADSGSSSGDLSPSLQAACDAYATAACTRYTECVASTFLDDNYDCKTTLLSGCLAQKTANSNVQPSDVDACRTKVSAETCSEVLNTHACRTPAGNLEEGKACKADGECASAFCAKGFDDCGTCAAVPAEGASCIKFGCGQDRVCHDGNKCVTPKKAGEACGEADSCLGSLSCVKGVCAAPLETEGASCDPDGKEAPKCNLLKALYCGPESKKCLSLTPAKVGEACGFLDAQVIVCTVSNFCNVGDGGTSGTCAPKVALGGTCGPQLECVPGLSCKSDKCVDPSTLTCN